MSKPRLPQILLLVITALIASSWIRPYLKGDVVKFREEFTKINYDEWLANTYQSEGNASDMAIGALSFDRSQLKITVKINKAKQDSSSKPFTGGGLESIRFYRYGNFSVRTKPDIKPGTVSSYYLMNRVQQGTKDKFYAIEIKFLGKDEGQIQFTVQNDDHGKKIIHQDVYNLGFNFKKKLHEYAIQWEENSIAFYVDNRLAKRYEVTIDQQLQLGINHWAVNENETTKWAGVMDTRSLPSAIYYDWINYTPL